MQEGDPAKGRWWPPSKRRQDDRPDLPTLPHSPAAACDVVSPSRVGKVFTALGSSVGVVVATDDTPTAQAAFAADVTYVTAQQLGFTYLRDNMTSDPETLVGRGRDWAGWYSNGTQEVQPSHARSVGLGKMARMTCVAPGRHPWPPTLLPSLPLRRC